MPDISENPLVITPGTVERGQTRARALSEGLLVADAVPRVDVRTDLLTPTETGSRREHRVRFLTAA